MNAFYEQVYAEVSRIPDGRVATYGQIARACGKPRGAREVGWAMRNCPEGIPWHRVVMADGCVAAGEWAGMRAELLAKEGVIFSQDGRVDIKACAWDGK